ncbi:MAG: hypothetical protein R3261_05525 [Alphaproteobacteria bacterium]|nr:hypothetical protein [Alphaproteobacteria bacterium]
MRAFWFANFALVLFSLTSISMLAAREQADNQYAVIFPPWMKLQEIVPYVGNSDVKFIRTGLWDSIVIVETTMNDFESTMQNFGAWAVLDPIFIGGCSPI